MDILIYISKNYKLKSLKDIIYEGCGCPFFEFDGIRFDCINLGDEKAVRNYKEQISQETKSDNNSSGDDLIDFLLDPSEPLNPLNPFSPLSVFNEDSNDNE